MGQFSMEIIPFPGSLLRGNQHFWPDKSWSAVETLAYPRMSPVRGMVSPKRPFYGLI
jgi:hypothetical protein